MHAAAGILESKAGRVSVRMGCLQDAAPCFFRVPVWEWWLGGYRNHYDLETAPGNRVLAAMRELLYPSDMHPRRADV
jgi:hypothetical protein